LQKKVSATLLAVMAVLAVLSYAILEAVVAPAFDNLEQQSARTNLVRAERALGAELASLSRLAIDWALHATQKIVAKSSEGIEVTIEVILNYELEREILGFGDSIVVMKPQRLRERIEKKLSEAVKNYLVNKIE
jgi:predicted DNA-binding transcriptional regulator YafY